MKIAALVISIINGRVADASWSILRSWALERFSRPIYLEQEVPDLLAPITPTALSPSSGFDNFDNLAIPARVELPNPISQAVHAVLGGVNSSRPGSERRMQRRHSFPYLVSLTPVDQRGVPLTDLSRIVVGRYISEQGFDFYHQEPLEFRRVVVHLNQDSSAPVSLLLDLSWCRFTRQGWYDSGGRFLEVVAPEDAAAFKTEHREVEA